MVKPYRWDPEKNEKLRRERGIGFEEILESMGAGGLLDTVEHPNAEKYGHQRLFVVRCREYVYCVPFVENQGEIFLKTIIPSRKMRKTYEKRNV